MLPESPREYVQTVSSMDKNPKSAKTENVDGVDYFVISSGVTADSHPFFTGKSTFVDTEGRIDKFQKRFGAVRRAGKPKLNS